MSSLYEIKFFKRHFFEHWGGYGIDQTFAGADSMHNGEPLGIFSTQFGRWGWKGDWTYDPQGTTRGWSILGPSGIDTLGYAESKNGLHKFGRPQKFPHFIDKNNGADFIKQAKLAQLAYIKSKGADSEEMWFLSKIMQEFFTGFRMWINIEHFRTWQGVVWSDNLPYHEYGKGPWTKPIYEIFKAFEEWKEYGPTIWDTIFEVLEKGPIKLKIPWSVAARKIAHNPSKQLFWDFFNKFFLAYDVNGGIDFPNLENWNTKQYPKTTDAYLQWSIAAATLGGEHPGLKAQNFKKQDWANYPWSYGSPKRAAALFGAQVEGALKAAEYLEISGMQWYANALGILDIYFVTGHEGWDKKWIDSWKDLKDRIIGNFEAAQLWGSSAQPSEEYRRPKTWMQEIGRKVKILINRGMWLAPHPETMTKLNIEAPDAGGHPEHLYPMWRLWDAHIDQRVGLPFLYVMKRRIGWDMGIEFGYKSFSQFHKLEKDGYAGPDNGRGTPEKYILIDAMTNNKQAFDQLFNDGLAVQHQGGKSPWIPIIEEFTSRGIVKTKYSAGGGTSEMKWTGMPPIGSPTGSVAIGNKTPKNGNNYISMKPSKYFDTDIPKSELTKQKIKFQCCDFASFHIIKKGSSIDSSLNSYGDFDQYITNHWKGLQVDDLNKAAIAKRRAYFAFDWSWGIKLEEEKNGKMVPANGQLGRSYQVFLSEYRKNLKDKNSPLTDKEFFEYGTNWLAFSMAAQVLSAHRDEILFELYDNFVEQTWEDETFSSEDAKNALEQAEKTQKEKAAAAAGQAKDAEEEDLTDEDIENRQPFYKQCFLLMNMDLLKDEYAQDIVQSINGKNSHIHSKGNEFKGRIRLIDTDATDGDKTSIINRLTSPQGDDIKSFFDARPELISALVPQIRLFRVQSKKVKPAEPNADTLVKLTEIEFDFPKHNNPDRSQYKGDLQGARDKWEFGIKEFSFSFDGTSPATARNDIKASLTLFFRDFNDLIKKRRLTEFTSYKSKFSDPVMKVLERSENQYSYLDLILFPGSVHQKATKHPFQYNPSEYRIRADVGWVTKTGQIPSSFIKLCKNSNTTPEDLKKSLEKINKSFYLNMVDHDLDFAVDGSVTIKIEYRAYMESSAKSISLDVLSTPAINSIRKNIQEEMNLMWGKCSAEDMHQLLQTYRTIESEMLKKSYQSIITRLLRRQRMMYVYSDAKDRELFKNLGFFDKRPKMYGGSQPAVGGTPQTTQLTNHSENNAFAKTMTYIDGELKQFNPKSYDPTQMQHGLEVINFFYVGDLFYTLMDCMYEAPDKTKPGAVVGKIRDDVKNTKLLLSSFKYKDPLDVKKDLEINIAQIPVSVDFFLEFMNKNVLEGERRNYPLMYFIRDFCNRLIVDLMNELCIKSINAENRIRFQTANLLALPITKGDDDPVSKLPMLSGSPIRNVTQGHKDKTLPFIGSLENRSINEAINYITIYPVASNMVTTDPNKAPRGIRSEDEANGIRHLYIGRPRGLVKTVKFSKVDMQYIREARYFNHGYNGLMQLGSVYKATIDMVGNTLFYPGMTVFIDPTSLASDGMDPTQGQDAGNAGQEPSIANALGIGGYHLITKVKSTIGPGKFNTSVDARFYYSGDGNTAQFQSPQQPTTNSGETEREQAIEETGKNTSLTTSTQACEAIIRIRQRQTGNLFGSEYNENLGTLNDQQALSKEADIAAKSEAESTALKQAQTAEEKKATEDAYKQRQAAIKQAKKP